MEKFSCQFCNKEFSSKSNLNNHIKTAKYCIEKRTEKIESEHSIHNYNCSFCEKSFATRRNILRHLSICKEKVILEENKNIETDKLLAQRDQKILILELQLLEKTREVEYLTQQLSSLALEGIKKSTVTNTSNRITNILSPLDLNDDKIKTIVEDSLDESYFLDAQKGIARFCFDKLIKTGDGKRKLVCSDPVRERYRYLDQDGNLKEDIGARNFIDKITRPIIETSKKVHINLKDRYTQIKADIEKGIEKEISDYLIDIKEKYADKCLLDIHDLPYDSTNRKFRKELSFKTNV